MKKLLVEITEEAHMELLRIQFERKSQKNKRTTMVQIASDVLNNCLTKKENPTK